MAPAFTLTLHFSISPSLAAQPVALFADSSELFQLQPVVNTMCYKRRCIGVAAESCWHSTLTLFASAQCPQQLQAIILQNLSYIPCLSGSLSGSACASSSEILCSTLTSWLSSRLRCLRSPCCHAAAMEPAQAFMQITTLGALQSH